MKSGLIEISKHTKQTNLRDLQDIMFSTSSWALIVSDCNTLITVPHVKLSGSVWLHLMKTWLNLSWQVG